MSNRVTRSAAPPILLAVCVLVVWQVAVALTNAPAYIVPSPIKIADAIYTGRSLLISAAGVSGFNALVGLAVGSICALVAAVIAHQLRLLDGVLGALAAGASAVPIVALAPLFYGMFSETGQSPREMTAAVFVFFPVYINVARGLKQVTPLHRELMHTLAASRWQTVRVLQLPSAAPFLFSGLRVAAPSAVITAIIAEYFGGPQDGLGDLITTAAQSSSFDQAWAFVAASVALGLIAFLASTGIENAVGRRLSVAQ